MILAGTGHRPETWPSGEAHPSHIMKLHNIIGETLLRLKPDLVISGGARGFDMSLAIVAQTMKIPVYSFAVHRQANAWPKDGFYGKDNYQAILDKSEQVHWYYKYKERDYGMVDAADQIVALYNLEAYASGTGMTVRYAEKKNKSVLNLWELFIKELYR